MRRAFTLIEIIIYLAVVGLIAVTLVTYSISISTSRAKAEVVSEVQSNVRFALAQMRQKIRAANSIDFPASVLGTDPGTLTLIMPSPAPSPVVFNLSADNGRLRMQSGSGPAEFITSDDVEVTDLRFINMTDGLREQVRIFMTMRYRQPGSADYQYEYSVEDALGVRF